jgi:hypothetical protein
LSEQISYIGYPAIINAKFTPEIKGLSIVAAARISNIAALVYSIYQHEPHFTLRRIELIDATNLIGWIESMENSVQSRGEKIHLTYRGPHRELDLPESIPWPRSGAAPPVTVDDQP